MADEKPMKSYVMRGSRHAGFFSLKADDSIPLNKYDPVKDAQAFYEAFFKLPARTALEFIEKLKKDYPQQMKDLPSTGTGNMP